MYETLRRMGVTAIKFMVEFRKVYIPLCVIMKLCKVRVIRMKYIDRILEIAEKHYNDFDAFKREIESKIKNSECSLIRHQIGTTDYYIPCITIFGKKECFRTIYSVPRKTFHVWIRRETKDEVTIEVVDLDTYEKRKTTVKLN